MNPMWMALGLSIANQVMNQGNQGKQGSTYSENAQQSLEELLNDLRGMKGGALNVQQNPNYMQGQEWLQSMFNDPDFFKSFEAPLQRQFEEQTVPDLANRFASMGSGGALGSTGFRNQLGREGSNLSTNIAALRGGMQQNAIPQLMQYAQQPTSNLLQAYGIGTTPTQNTYQPPSAGPLAGPASAMWGGAAYGMGQNQGQSFAGASPSTQAGYASPGQYPLTNYYDQQMRQGGYY